MLQILSNEKFMLFYNTAEVMQKYQGWMGMIILGLAGVYIEVDLLI